MAKRCLCLILALLILLSLVACGNQSEEETFDFTVDPVRVHEYEEATEPDESEEETNHILKAQAVGAWIRNLEKDTQVGMRNAYDMKKGSRWNPQTLPKYDGNPGVVFLLDGYYDVDSWSVQVDKRNYYFDLYVSNDGQEYTKVMSITKENAQQYYDDSFLCVIPELEVKNVAFIKMIFTGAADNTTYINLHEVSFTGTFLDIGPYEIPEDPNKVEVPATLISSHRIIGSWKNDKANDASYGPKLSYDENMFTRWNPEGKPKMQGNPGIIFTLKRATDIGKLELVFSTAPHYFDLYVSADGDSYKKVANIHARNANRAYKDGDFDTLICTLDGLELKSIRYLKIMFKGRPNNNTFVNLIEVLISEEGATGLNNSWMLMAEQTENPTDIVSHEIVGNWRDDGTNKSASPDKSYDGDYQTKWNPVAGTEEFDGEPGIIYKLRKPCTLGKLTFTLGTEMHWFDVYVSTDGAEFTQIAAINKHNAEQAYTNGNGGKVCTLNGLNLEDIQYIKVIYTGRATPKNAYVNAVEVAISQTVTPDLDISWMIPEDIPEDPQAPVIVSYETVGNWRDDGTNKSASPDKSYDGDYQTKWNPVAGTEEFDGEPGIIYTLSEPMPLGKLTFTLGTEMHWFDVYVSTDGAEFTQIAAISQQNAEKAYTDGNGGKVCTLDGLNLEDIQYIKVIYTGRATPKNAYVNAVETELSQTGTPDLDVSWMLPEETPEEPTEPGESQVQQITITNGVVGGTWKDDASGKSANIQKAYDGDLNTKWNPTATDFASDEHAVFTLDGNYDLSRIVITVASRYHFFTLYGSADGQNYTQLAKIDSSNYSTYYLSDYVCTVDGLSMESVKYVKVNVDGTPLGIANCFVNLQEIQVFGVPGEEVPEITEPDATEPDATEPDATEPDATEPDTTEPDTTEPDATEPAQPNPETGMATITTGVVGGTWKDDASGKTANIQKAYDGDLNTKWNPTATDFASDEHAIFTLAEHYDLSRIVITVASRYHFFTLYGSADGQTYTQIARVDNGNYTQYYQSGYTCTVSGLSLDDVKYIKVGIDGSPLGTANCFVNFHEIQVYGTPTEK